MNKQTKYIKYCKEYEEMRNDIIKLFQSKRGSKIFKEKARNKAQRNIPFPKNELCEICHNKLHGVVITK
jgi:hypothetical protein